ncbi:hypothetical protein AAFF_G00139640 [Aldrovandia affinis]|uniref:Uncharacterized protein n=1 Tax=Aldrovandia affinis TaxID=143900 RepID=A0AAD7TC86_9TELE|nr:hypothetical protein AAFF_G00139640 [Aldrovandia affinis]
MYNIPVLAQFPFQNSSPRHQGHLSLDFSHKPPSDFSESSHNHMPQASNSLPLNAALESMPHSSCSDSCLSSPPQLKLKQEMNSATSSQSQTSAASLPGVAVNPVLIGERRKDSEGSGQRRGETARSGCQAPGGMGQSVCQRRRSGCCVASWSHNSRREPKQVHRGHLGTAVPTDTPSRPDRLPSRLTHSVYGSVSLEYKMAVEAYLEMVKTAEIVIGKFQRHIDEFTALKDTLEIDSIALFHHMGNLGMDLSFKKDDILSIDDSLLKGCADYWMTWHLDENAQKLQRGRIPSKSMRRRHAGLKNRKDHMALDALSTDSISFFDGGVSLAYHRMQKVHCTSPQPVLILFPLVDMAQDMLIRDSPKRFCRCQLDKVLSSLPPIGFSQLLVNAATLLSTLSSTLDSFCPLASWLAKTSC